MCRAVGWRSMYDRASTHASDLCAASRVSLAWVNTNAFVQHENLTLSFFTASWGRVSSRLINGRLLSKLKMLTQLSTNIPVDYWESVQLYSGQFVL
jgi:hypothetical protein